MKKVYHLGTNKEYWFDDKTLDNKCLLSAFAVENLLVSGKLDFLDELAKKYPIEMFHSVYSVNIIYKKLGDFCMIIDRRTAREKAKKMKRLPSNMYKITPELTEESLKNG